MFFVQLFSSLILNNKISINLLPNEILLEILENLINYTSYKYITSLKIVCKRWNTLIQHCSPAQSVEQ
jgi:hypothetical protein